MAERMKKIEATSVEKIRKEDVEDFVRETLLQDGFPTQGWKRYVYFQSGYLKVTDEVSENTYLIWGDDEFVVFVIESREKYESTICVPLEEYGLSESSPISDWIVAYLNDSFEDWTIEDWM